MQNKGAHAGGRWCHFSSFPFISKIGFSVSLGLSSQALALPAPADVSAAGAGVVEGAGGRWARALGSLPLLAGWCATGLFCLSSRLETGKDAEFRSCFSSRVKWLPLSTSRFKMRGKPEEKMFDVVQLRNPSGGSKPGNAGVKGSVGAVLALPLPGLCFLMANVP